jgi:acyl-CoA thioesterase I
MLYTLFVILSCSNQSTVNSSSTIAASTTLEIQEEKARPRIIILGDSLTAGLGLAVDTIYPSLVSKQFDDQGLPTEILNAGVSGDTTAGGLRRLDWLLQQKPDLLMIELGGNDGLRGIPLQEIESNISSMIERAQNEKVDVMLMSMQIPSNFGADYTTGFIAIYPKLAEKYDIPLVPFLLDGVAGEQTLNQADGIHPTEEGHAIIANTVFKQLRVWRNNWKPPEG